MASATEESRRAVAAVLERHLPDLGTARLEPAGEGDFCVAWLLDGSRIVRAPRHAAAAEALRREACLLPRIAPLLSHAVPLPTLVREGERILLSVHELVPGDPLSRRLWQELDGRDRVRLAREVGGFLLGLHGIEPAAVGGCDLPVADHRALAGTVLGRLEGSGDFPTDLVTRLTTVLRQAAHVRPDTTPSAPLHGDFGPGHVLVDTSTWTIQGVIDWGDALVGEPARDFVFVYEDWGDAFLREALAGYGLAGPRASRFRRRVLYHYLVDQSDWTLDAAERGASHDVRHGLDALEAALRELREDG